VLNAYVILEERHRDEIRMVQVLQHEARFIAGGDRMANEGRIDLAASNWHLAIVDVFEASHKPYR